MACVSAPGLRGQGIDSKGASITIKSFKAVVLLTTHSARRPVELPSIPTHPTKRHTQKKYQNLKIR